MGLDLYVGPLCRYYSGDWETVFQQLGRAQNLQVTVVRPEPRASAFERLLAPLASLFRSKPQEPVDPVALVLDWRRKLANRLGLGGEPDWDWPEALDLPYDTDKPGWEGFGAVQLWAAYAENPDKKRPATFPKNWGDDPVLKAALEGSPNFRHILGPELWLPVRYPETFEAEEPGGDDDVKIGSVFELLEELKRLNDRTWRASPESVREWQEHGFEPNNFESIASWGYSIWFRLAERAASERLPMRLDY
jgi:hypothetical protein